MMNRRLIATVLLATGGSFILLGLVLLATGQLWAFWAPAFVVGFLDLLAAFLFLRTSQ